MDTKEVKQKKQALEDKIEDLILEFEKESGIAVSGIDFFGPFDILKPKITIKVEL